MHLSIFMQTIDLLRKFWYNYKGGYEFEIFTNRYKQ